MAMIGSNLSHYHILEELGRGGMGVVYKAEDTRLDRIVAIKVLPSSTLTTEDDRARFYQEAKAAARLQHPHIASVFEIDEATPSDTSHHTGPAPFIAMEFVDGEALDAHIKKGPLDLKEAVRIATEIADGLQAAHKKNIVHRDVKSANVMIDFDGHAKIMDFGLALTARTTRLTRMNATLGTVAYMSPEQARAEDVDHRTDIWALGVTLYEMITGTHPFGGDYEQAVIYSILNEDPEPLTAVRSGVPMELERIVEKCLSKQAEFRYQHATDLIADLKAVDFTTFSSHSRVQTHGPLRDGIAGISLGQIAVVVLVGVITGTLWFLFSGSRSSKSDSASFTGILNMENESGEPITPVAANGEMLAISDDGRKVVLSAGRDNDFSLYVREIDNPVARPIPGTESGRGPAISPDGKWVAYCDESNILKVRLDGGLPIPLIQHEGGPMCRGVEWLGNDRILYVPGWTHGVYIMNADGSDSELLIEPDSTLAEISYRFPKALIDGSGFVFTARTEDITSADEATIAFYDVNSGKITRLFPGGSFGQVVDDRYIVFARNKGLYGIDFHRETLTVGEWQLLIPDVDLKAYQNARFDLSPNGTLIYDLDRRTVTRRFMVIGPDSTRSLQIPPTAVSDMSLHPDEESLILEQYGAHENIYRINFGDGARRRITFRGNNQDPAWKPDGNTISFWSDRDRRPGIYEHNLETDSTIFVYPVGNKQDVGNWTPDGNTLVMTRRDSIGGDNIWTITHTDTGSFSEPLIDGPANAWQPQLSDDGRRMAYRSNETGEQVLYVVDFPSLANRIRVATGASRGRPRWGADSDRIFYIASDRRLIRAELSNNAPVADTSIVSLPESVRVRSFDVFQDESVFTIYDHVATDDNRQEVVVRIKTDFVSHLEQVFGK